MKELKLSIKNKTEIEKFVLITIIGLMESLKDGLVTIDECEVCLYSPYSVEKLKNLKIDIRVVELVEEGCELEDIESLVPEELENVILSIKSRAAKLLLELYKKKITYKKWID